MKSKRITELKALFHLTRPVNLFFVVLGQILASFYILKLPLSSELLLLFTGTLLITAAGYVINDYFDIKADAVNKPHAVYIGRQVSRRKSLLFVFIQNSIALVLAIFISREVALIYSIVIVLLWLYSYLLKRSFFIGNLLVACLAGFSIYILKYIGHSSNLLLAYVFFAFMSNLIREIIKDCEDIKGDLLLGATTVPIVIGLQKTRYMILALIILFIGTVGYCTYHFNSLGIYILSSVIVILSCLIIYFVFLGGMSSGFKKASTTLKFIMLIGCFSIFLL